MYSEEEVYFNCPYCFQNISMVFESLYGGQEYIEDCEVCCRPILVKYKVTDGQVEVTWTGRANE